jgi:hypothetical protein
VREKIGNRNKSLKFEIEILTLQEIKHIGAGKQWRLVVNRHRLCVTGGYGGVPSTAAALFVIPRRF